MRRPVAALLLAILLGPLAPPARAASPPAGLPDHFALGLTARPDESGLYGWMPNSGLPWDYAYQYLTFGWTTWNADAQFPLLYARGAQQRGYRPVFPYDWLLQDVGSSPDPRLDAAALGTTAGQFASAAGAGQSPAGVSTYDLIFTDVADRDAAYYKYVYGDPSRWWDRLDVAVPNFHRWEQYIAAVVRATGRPAMVWQIAVGNQYYRSENNGDGHYQDNRVEYFTSHVDELVDAGVIGLLFGAGNAGSTAIDDAKGDGVTNPAPLCRSDGLSSGQICADHESALPDDDGGYLRLAAQRYYASPRQLAPAAPAPTPSSRALRLPLVARASGAD